MNKYLVFDSIDENKNLNKKYNDVFNGIRDKIKEINSNECECEKELIFQNGLMLIKQIYQKNVIFVTVGMLKILVLNINLTFVMHVLI